MAMTSSQIRAALKYLTDTVQAFAAAEQVVAAAEAAERTLADLEKKKDGMLKEQEMIQQRTASYEQQFIEARNKFHAEADQAGKSKVNFEREISELRAERNELSSQVQALRMSLDNKKATIDDEIDRYREEKFKLANDELNDLGEQIQAAQSKLRSEQEAFDKFLRDRGLKG